MFRIRRLPGLRGQLSRLKSLRGINSIRGIKKMFKGAALVLEGEDKVPEEIYNPDNIIFAGDVIFQGPVSFADGTGHPTWQPTVITVGKFGGEMYPTIQEAIDSITDASVARQYTLRISGGVYNEAITLTGYIHLIGAGEPQIKSDASEPAITVSGGGVTQIYRIRVQPATGSAPGIICTSTDLRIFQSYFYRGITFSGNSETFLDMVTCGRLIWDGGDTLHLTARSSDFADDISFLGVGSSVFVRIESCRIKGQIITTDCQYQLELYQVQLLDDSNRPLLYLDPANAFSLLQMQGCLLSTISTENTIERNAVAGTVEVWTMQNALSSAYGPNVNENITTPYNVIDAEIANFRL